MLWPMQVMLSSTLHAQLLAQARAAQPLECCGLLFGTGDVIDYFEPAINVSGAPERAFEIDPVTLIAAERAMRQGGNTIIGYYHSHPNGRAEPSPRDAAAAACDGRLWLVVTDAQITAWRACRGGALLGVFDRVALQLTD
jgi:proteasome lid subunit RPN8/RPN11